jgi:NadR type nicotinamide-nucleotide adenylyltransferase
MREYQCWTGGGSWEPPPERDDDEKKKDDDGDGGDDDGGGEARDDASGLILGRFDPPHRGHGYLFDVAGRWVSHLTIAVAGRDGDAVELRRRVAWVREMAPRARVIRVDGDSLEAQIAALREELPVEATYLFSSERDLGAPLDGIATRHVVVDPDRLAVPISATMIRFDPLEHWAYLPEVVRPYAVRRVRIVGAESTGKTTLASALARRFGTCWVPEYARAAAEARGGDLGPGDFDDVARGQVHAEDAAAGRACRLLFCDTDLLTASLWAERIGVPRRRWWRAEIERRPYDLTLVCADDVPFVGAPGRDDPGGRARFARDVAAAVEAEGGPVVAVRGRWSERSEIATRAIRALLLDGSGLAGARAPFLDD